MGSVSQALGTGAVQWMERTLDDRYTFLALSSPACHILDLVFYISSVFMCILLIVVPFAAS